MPAISARGLAMLGRAAGLGACYPRVQSAGISWDGVNPPVAKHAFPIPANKNSLLHGGAEPTAWVPAQCAADNTTTDGDRLAAQ